MFLYDIELFFKYQETQSSHLVHHVYENGSQHKYFIRSEFPDPYFNTGKTYVYKIIK